MATGMLNVECGTNHSLDCCLLCSTARVIQKQAKISLVIVAGRFLFLPNRHPHHPQWEAP